MHIKTANGKKKVVMSRGEWLEIGKRAGWNQDYIDDLKEKGRATGLKENTRFYDPRTEEEGTLVTRTYHQTTMWMMLYDSGEIQELTASDLKKIREI